MKNNCDIIYKINTNSLDLPITEFVKFLQKIYPSSGWNEEFFRWKHFENPCGVSILVWAISNDEIVGFRAMWKMNLKKDEEIILAYQPCDTAVLKEYRGRGIFSKMTKIARKKALEEGSDIIFNFPTPLSLGGYLKLGWNSQPKICRYISVEKPIDVFLKSFKNKWWTSPFIIEMPRARINSKNLDYDLWQNKKKGSMILNLYQKFLYWRLCLNPKIIYGLIKVADQQLIYRVGYRGKIKVVELVAWTKRTLDKLDKKLIKKINHLEKPEIISVVSSDNGLIFSFNKFFIKAPSKLNFISYNNVNKDDVKSIFFEPILYDTI